MTPTLDLFFHPIGIINPVKMLGEYQPHRQSLPGVISPDSGFVLPNPVLKNTSTACIIAFIITLQNINPTPFKIIIHHFKLPI
jgi:hypothetical protein